MQQGIAISKPTLIMHSNQSTYGNTWNEKFNVSDAVLNVKEIEKYAQKIQGKVTIMSIQNGMHDLVLSQKQVRQSVYNQLLEWLKLNL